MIYRAHVCKRFIQSLTSLSKSNMNANKCYFRHIENEEKVDITFLFNLKNNYRQFNLSRNKNEDVKSLCSRISTNVQKVLNKKVKKKNISDEGDIVVQFRDEKENIISDIHTCNDLFHLGPLNLKISDQVYEVVFNAPWIINLNLPKCILAGFPIYPENLELRYAEKKLSLFKWYRGKVVNDKGNSINENNVNWQFIVDNFYYTPTSDDIGLKLKLECIPRNTLNTGPSVEVVSKNVIEAGPGLCPFESRHMFTIHKLKENSFRCVSYNILADLYCDSDYTRTVLHPYCPPYALEIDYRKLLILKELLGYNADVICLQEVDNKVFNNSLIPILEDDGFGGLFYKKGKSVTEGLACFYRKTRFRFLGEKHILLADAIKTETYLKHISDVVARNEKLQARLLDRSTVASATYLQSCDKDKEVLIVGNTHLYFHPDADHIRLIQGGIVIHWLENIRNELQAEFPDKCFTIILCGDFNSDPSSGIYRLYTTGVAPSSLPDWKSNAEEAVTDLSFTQSVSLGSACGTPQYTNFTDGFAECLDYIYYDKSKLEVEQVVPFPSVEELKAHTALPSIVFPSDHIAVVSDLRFKQI